MKLLRRLCALLIVLLLIAIPALARENVGTITTNGQCVFLSSPDTGNGAFQITGTWTGTLSFYATLEGLNWASLNVFIISSTGSVTSTTTNGVWTYSGAFNAVRVCATASMTGTANIKIVSTWAGRGGGGGSGGGGIAGCTSDGTTLTCPAFAGNGPVSNSTFTGTINFCADAGANDTYACDISAAPSQYTAGALYAFKANTANTGAATINFNSLGAKTIKKVAGGITTDLADNDIRAGQYVIVMYDGTNMQIQSTLGNAAAGGGGISTNRVYLTKSVTQSIPDSTITAVTWDTELYDDGGLHSTVSNTGRITAVTAGVYVFTCSFAYETASGGGYRQNILRLNGTTYIAFGGLVGPGSFSGTIVAITNSSVVYKMALNDYVECLAYQDTGAAVNVAASATIVGQFSAAQVQN